MRKISAVTLLTLLITLAGCNQRAGARFEKKLTFPDMLTADQKVKLSAYVIPTQSQYEWQQTEMVALIYFGMNTFTGRESGSGTESPAQFNPTALNAEQWVTTLRDAGFKMIILTAKHHDGFCLWPTATTPHSVASSPWQNGLGDVVKEVKDACDKHHMKFGIYLSPCDRNADPYGNSPHYNALFARQLTELLTGYGAIHLLWFDETGADRHGRRTELYDWPRFYRLADSIRPRALKAITGNDVRRACGSDGLGRDTEWSVTPLQPPVSEAAIGENLRLKITPTAKDLGSRRLIAEAKTVHWYPSAVNVPLRPGHFHHPEEDEMLKTPSQLTDIYCHTVGMNSVLVLSVSPDRQGLLPPADAERLKQFGTRIARIFGNEKLINGNAEWKAPAGTAKEYGIIPGETINTLLLREEIRKGQRVEKFAVQGWIDDEWVDLAAGTTIGNKRLLRFHNVSPSRLRVIITETRDIATITRAGAYYIPSPEKFAGTHTPNP
jgi:alpha-L-fucosidase